MRVIDLYDNITFEEVIEASIELGYAFDTKKAIKAWDDIMVLCLEDPEPSNIAVQVGKIEDEDITFWDVVGWDGKDYIALEFTKWEEWLGMEVSNLKDLTDVELLALIFEEMTFCGYSQEVIQSKMDDLLKISEGVENGTIKTYPFEELLNEKNTNI